MASPICETPPLGAAGSGDNSQRLAANDVPENNRSHQQKQAISYADIAASISCAAMRADALRFSTEILLDQLQVKILTAKSFNRQGLDDDADESLREVWRLLRVTITPVRNELQRLREGQL